MAELSSRGQKHRRRSILKFAGISGIGGALTVIGSRFRKFETLKSQDIQIRDLQKQAELVSASQTGLGAQSAKSATKLYSEEPGWVSWTQPALNAGDTWSQENSWMTEIENSKDLEYYHDSFSSHSPSKAAHHWVMVIDLRKCIGCQSCVVACKSENNVPIGVFRTWVQVVEYGSWEVDPDGDGPIEEGGVNYVPNVKRFSLPRLCNHCDDPPCVEVCPVKATFKREDGIVLIDYPKCLGCGYCIQACPYDARYFNPIQQTADKCTFCVHRIDRGLLPACVTSCVGRARVFGDLNDPTSEVGKLISQFPTDSLNIEAGTKPQVFYINLDGNLVDAQTSLDTIYPYASGMNTNQYANLTGSKVLEGPTLNEGGNR